MRVFALLGWAILIGLLAGVFLDVLTFLVARYGPQGDSWSFRCFFVVALFAAFTTSGLVLAPGS